MCLFRGVVLCVWQVKRRKRTRHLIELGGLAIKAGFVELTNDDPAMIYGALQWIADELQSEHAQRARELWATKGVRGGTTHILVRRATC